MAFEFHVSCPPLSFLSRILDPLLTTYGSILSGKVAQELGTPWMVHLPLGDVIDVVVYHDPFTVAGCVFTDLKSKLLQFKN